MLDQESQELDVVVGDFVVLTCKVISGTGKINVKWVVDGRVVPNGLIRPTVFVSVHFH